MAQIRAEAHRDTQKAVQNSQAQTKFQEYRVRTELRKVDFMEQMHLSLYDIMEAAQPAGSFTFNELDKESVEFRYYLDGVIDQSMPVQNKPLLVIGS